MSPSREECRFFLRPPKSVASAVLVTLLISAAAAVAADGSTHVTLRRRGLACQLNFLIGRLSPAPSETLRFGFLSDPPTFFVRYQKYRETRTVSAVVDPSTSSLGQHSSQLLPLSFLGGNSIEIF